MKKETAVIALSSFIREVKPKMVVSVLKRTRKLVEEAVQKAQLVVTYRALPYPTRNYVTEYCSGLKEFLAELQDARM
jgi:hypothetical protein